MKDYMRRLGAVECKCAMNVLLNGVCYQEANRVFVVGGVGGGAHKILLQMWDIIITLIYIFLFFVSVCQ